MQTIAHIAGRTAARRAYPSTAPARQRATEDNAPDLAEWADRLEQALHASPPAAQRRPLLDAAAHAVRARPAPPPEPTPEVPRYVGGIR